MKRNSNERTFLGFGLGAVQSGLMLFEAYKSGNFNRYVILEVNKDIVEAVRKNGNKIIVNTAKKDGIIKSVISEFEIYNPSDPSDYKNIITAIKSADEMATAVPSVEFYDAGQVSIARLLAENINSDKLQVLYAAENNNYAAEILTDKIKKNNPEKELRHFQAVNTVIGKMGGVIFDPLTVKELDLNWMTPFSKAVILVEEFNSIIISKITLPGFNRGIEVFQEKDDLLPFEEAKLFGHNAVHSMLGFFAALKNYTYMSEIKDDKHLYQYGIDAFIKESGAFLLKKYSNLDEPLFTKDGFNFYGMDLLERMTNPYLRDEVKRICRDPVRKLEYGDRLFGTIREALNQNIHPKIFIKAVLAGLCYLIQNKTDADIEYPDGIKKLNEKYVRNMLNNIWKCSSNNDGQEEIIAMVCAGLGEFTAEFLN